MAAPTVTSRVDPPGIPLDDGYRTTIAFARDPNINFWEKTVQPPGIDGGDAIDTTTMHNDTWRTMRARALKTLTTASCKVAYDPAVFSEISELINQEGAITIHLPDLSTISFFGYLKSFQPAELQEGTQPEATVEIICTNWDPTNDVEAGPAISSVAGT